MITPPRSAAQNGLPGNLNATDSASQVNQFLGTPVVTELYPGTAVQVPSGGTQFQWIAPGNTSDFDQLFVLSGTTVSRVTLPIQPTGNGADLLVSLWPDNGSGSPNTSGNPIAATMLPAAYLTQVCAADGLANAGPLATERDNALYIAGGITTTLKWTAPAGSSNGYFSSSAFTYSGDWSITAGGQDPVSSASVALVASFSIGADGTLGLPVPQPALPLVVQDGTLLATTDTLVHCGGKSAVVGSGATVVANVWSASWDPNTGVIGTWSAQTALPAALWEASGAVSGNVIYVVGGLSSTNVTQSKVYYAAVINGQVQPWKAADSLPVAVAVPFVQAVNGWLIVAGGASSAGVDTSGTYYARIMADGSLGPWQTGPSIVGTLEANSSGGWNTAATDSAVVILGGLNSSVPIEVDTVQILMVTQNGVADHWVETVLPNPEANAVAVASAGAGVWALLSMNMTTSSYESASLVPVPVVSVPLAATGLTNGAVYHIVVQQNQQATDSDFLSIGIVDAALPDDALISNRHSGVWSVWGTGYSIPMTVYNNTGGQNAIHLVKDPVSGVNQSWDTLFYAGDGTARLIGHTEVTMQPNNPLNSNPTFTTTTAPWTATHGVLTQSNVQTHGGFPFSGLLTPTGGFTQAYIASEEFPVSQGGGPFYGTSQWYLADGWFFSPTGWANFSLNINWFTENGTYISTTGGSTVSLAANTWTHVQTYAVAPATAAFGQVLPTENATPGATNLLYCSDVFVVVSPECVGSFSSAATVNYPTSASPWPPVGVTQLL